MEATLEDVISRLGAFQHIEREKSVEEFKKLAEGGDLEANWATAKAALKRLQTDEAWEHRLGAMLGAKVALLHVEDAEYMADMEAWCVSLLADPEVRIRLALGQVLSVAAQVAGASVWERCREVIIDSITANFDRDAASVEADAPEDDRDTPGSPGLGSASAARGAAGPPPSASLMGALLQEAYKPAQPGAGNLRHGTEGWKCLETSVRAMHEIMAGCGAGFAPHATEEVRSLLYRCFDHANRFVRETGYLALSALCRAISGTPALEGIAVEVAGKLVDGLSDNWSQVRYASSTAARDLLMGIEERLDDALARVMPAMCLNRYYVAEGVRVLSQETWKLLMKDQGRETVARHIDAVVPYYIMQSKANNHAVREAACACMAELTAKVDRTAVEPHVQALLRALLNCFKDESWPVRDAACMATASAVAHFPAAAAPILSDLYALWFDHLWDNIYSVRENSAVSLGLVAAAIPHPTVPRIIAWLEEHLLLARTQESESVQNADLENTTLFGVASKRARDNDVAQHTDQTMFSCGSLAPKLARGGGCMDHGFTRPKQPWEASDGAIYLMRALATVDAAATAKLLPTLAELASVCHFDHATKLRETLWNCLPLIAGSMGKKAFKPHLDSFLEPMFNDLKCDHQLCECAAGKCVAAFRDMLGAKIFAGRLDSQQLRELDQNQNIPAPAVCLASPAGAAGGAAPAKEGFADMMSRLGPGAQIPSLLNRPKA